MGYGKINQDGYLMSSNRQKDNTWIPLTEFQKDNSGEYYEKYTQDGLPDTNEIDKIQDEKLAIELKEAKIKAVEDIIVSVYIYDSPRPFQGDEKSQDRMSRAITAMDSSDKITWILADNTRLNVTKSNLQRVLRLAGQEQARIWICRRIEDI